MRRVWVTVLAALSASAALQAADWPQFRGPACNGISPEKGIRRTWRPAPRLLWQTRMSDNGYAGPSVAGGRVYIVDHQGRNDVVRAIDLNTGKDVWRFAYPDAANDNYGFARATPTVNGGKVYTLSRTGMVHCLDAARGKKIWGYNIITTFQGKPGGWDLAGSPFIDGNQLILVPGGATATVVAVNKNTGKPIWRCAANDAAGYATPVLATLAGKRQYLIFSATKLFGVETRTGRLLWSVPWKTQYDVNAASPIAIGNSVFITSNYGHGCALVDVTPSGARIRWQNREIQSQFSTPILARGMLFSTSDPGNLVCLDPRTGRVAWKQRGFEKGGIAAVDGMLIVVDGSNGDVALVSLDTARYRELGRFRPLGGQSWTAPVIADGKLILRNKQTLACFSLK